MKNYHSESLNKRQKTTIILGMVYIALEDDQFIDEKEGFAIQFNADLLNMSMEEYQQNLSSINVVDDQLLFKELSVLDNENKNFITRAFHSVANSSEIGAEKKIQLMCNILIEDVKLDFNQIMTIIKNS